jgi:hypothetical protein
MTKIFSKFHSAVTFLCYFLLVVAKESKPELALLEQAKEKYMLPAARPRHSNFQLARVTDARQLRRYFFSSETSSDRARVTDARQLRKQKKVSLIWPFWSKQKKRTCFQLPSLIARKIMTCITAARQLKTSKRKVHASSHPARGHKKSCLR